VAWANVFVQVKKGLAGVEVPPPPQEPVVLDQHGCTYVPHVVGLRVRPAARRAQLGRDDAQRALLPRSARGNPGDNYNQPQGTAEIETRFAAAEVGARAGCDLHPWMSSWISAVDHPFFAVSGSGGAFTIEGLPPGAYHARGVARGLRQADRRRRRRRARAQGSRFHVPDQVSGARRGRWRER
jgi:hypothetical protein